MDYSPPSISEAINRLIFEWDKLQLKVVTDRITDAGTAELWFYHVNGKGESLLHTTKANLMSTSTMGQIAKRMEKHFDDRPWIQMLTCISSKTMEYQRRGEPGLLLEPSKEKAVHPGYFIEPFIMKGVPNVIYGDPGVNKTTIALSCLGLVALGCNPENSENSIGLYSSCQANVAMLYWESTDALIQYTLSRLILGETIPFYPLPYLRCKQSLTNDIERITNFLADNKAQVILIDSLGHAAGSEKFDNAGKDAAIKFFECLRQLKVTSLIIGQNAKNEEGKKSIFGSVYFTYYSRNVFELRGKQDELNQNQMHIALFHEKSNYSKKYDPMGYCVSYTDDTINIVPESVSFSQFSEKASQTKALLEYLKDGAKNRKMIASELQVSEKHSDVLLSRLKKRGLIVSLGSGMWGLAMNDEAPNSGA